MYEGRLGVLEPLSPPKTKGAQRAKIRAKCEDVVTRARFLLRLSSLACPLPPGWAAADTNDVLPGASKRPAPVVVAGVERLDASARSSRPASGIARAGRCSGEDAGARQPIRCAEQRGCAGRAHEGVCQPRGVAGEGPNQGLALGHQVDVEHVLLPLEHWAKRFRLEALLDSIQARCKELRRRARAVQVDPSELGIVCRLSLNLRSAPQTVVKRLLDKARAAQHRACEAWLARARLWRGRREEDVSKAVELRHPPYGRHPILQRATLPSVRARVALAHLRATPIA